ncbi:MULTISPECIES: DHA2 family efflux MFS transporter permease subunit [unclassified Amycolatopsis]|uniref:DHA2 family efflux MFS transporter permease subunit n=1 Tax=unclassified Amycolatopsis TaxID=2618356 RepID=UPI000A60CEFD|nr:DHA2 family efflux MFS transporter permease subunit [Amycolatopsis sp. Poz14]MCG3756608.1 DHA2 family efflux MFS transporter permease subunit [Amycolatopsis sp. Poz14]
MTTVAAPIDRATWRICWIIVFGAFASGLDASVVTIGLDSISSDLGADLSVTQWIASGYLLALALSLPLTGWLARRFGAGRVWLVALAAFTVTSGLCAAAPDVVLLIAFRFLQGLAGGVLIPAGQTVLGQQVGAARLGRVMATLGIAVSVAPALGPLAGGLILHGLSWPWLFLINLPIGAVGLVLGLRYVPRGSRENPGGIDFVGLALIAAGLPLVLYTITTWGDTGQLEWPILVPGLVLLVWFVRRRHPRPLLDFSLYRNRLYRAASLAAAFNGALIFGSGIVVTLYFQLGRHLDFVDTGLSLLGFAGATAAIAPVTGRAVDRYGAAPVALVGAVLAVVCTVPFAFLPVDAPGVLVQILLAGYGASVALVSMPMGIAAYKTVEPSRLPDAAAQVTILLRVGGSLGGAVFAVLIAGRLPDVDAAFRLGFAAISVGAVGALGTAWMVRRAS